MRHRFGYKKVAFSQRNTNSMSERARSRKSFLHAAFCRLLGAPASYHRLTLRRALVAKDPEETDPSCEGSRSNPFQTVPLHFFEPGHLPELGH
jgi:hypothetical protein